MNPLFSLAIITLFLLIQSSLANSDDKPTVYDAIQQFNFPVGILPQGIQGYELDQSTGRFSAYIGTTCSFSIQGSYSLSYKSTIKGRISKNKLTNLEGVKVKLFFIWVDIIEVDRIGENLQFSVGIASAGFSVDNFLESPQCGCGFNCGDKQHVSNLRTNPFAISSY